MSTEAEPSDTNAASDLQAKIIRQVEYYFGDFNLPRDRFLREKTKIDDGWVTLATLLTFNRLKSLTTDESVVAEALKKSPNNLLEVSEDGKKVRRSVEKPLPESNKENQEKLDELTVYAKGFPVTTTIDDLLEFFGKFGNCLNVFMRRLPSNRKFKGSVFATYSTREEAERFIKEEGVKFNEVELVRCMKKEHAAEKQQLREKRLAEKAKKKENSGDEETEEAELEEENIILGCLLNVVGLVKGTSWEDIKEFFSPYAEVAFVDYTRGKDKAVIRFAEEGSAPAVLEKLKATEQKIIIRDAEITGSVLEGEEEIEYWKKMASAKKDKRGRGRGRGGGGKSRGRGGRQGVGRVTRQTRSRTSKANGKEAAEDTEVKEDAKAATAAGDGGASTKKLEEAGQQGGGRVTRQTRSRASKANGKKAAEDTEVKEDAKTETAAGDEGDDASTKRLEEAPKEMDISDNVPPKTAPKNAPELEKPKRKPRGKPRGKPSKREAEGLSASPPEKRAKAEGN